MRNGIVKRAVEALCEDLPWWVIVMALPPIFLLVYLCQYIPIRWATWGMVGLVVLFVAIGTLSLLRYLWTWARAIIRAMTNVRRRTATKKQILVLLFEELVLRLIGLLLIAAGCVPAILFLRRIVDAASHHRMSLIALLLALAGALVFFGFFILSGFGMLLWGRRALTSHSDDGRTDRGGREEGAE